MDYEKAFKEAHERASLRFGTNVANELFLEYKESKEERTRRKLIEFFSDWSKTKSHCWGIRVTDIMDWLEKQGTSYTKRDVDDAFVEGMAFAKDELEKKGEQKHALDIEIPFGAKDSELQEATYLIPEGFHAEIKDNEVLIKKGKQRPTWSEEDELHIRELESLVKQVWTIAEHENDKDNIHKMSDLSFFLKTLKPQLKQEWKPTKEQMYMLEWLTTNVLDDGVVGNKAKEVLYTLIEQLKSIKE